MNKTLSVYDKFFLLGVGLILISKMAIFKDTNIITIISYSILLGMIVILFLDPNKSKNINISLGVNSVLTITFVVFCIIFQIFTKRNYIFQDYFLSIILTFILFFIGYFYSNKSERFIILLLKVYIYSVLLICINIYIENFVGIGYSSINQYILSEKNAVGSMIVFSLIVLSHLFNLEKINLKRIIYAGIAIFMLYTMMMIQNRSGLLSLLPAAILIFIRIVKSIKNINFKMINIALILVMILIIVVIINFDKISDFLVWSLRLESLSAGGVDSISSGRVTYIKEALACFERYPLYGYGSLYVDNLYICIISQFGIIGSLPLISIILGMVIFCIKNYFKVRSELSFTLLLLCISSMVISLFEGLAPFGPGTSYILLWFLYGYSSNMKINY